MPTLTIDPYLTAYEERADLVYDYAEWGTNRQGGVSHATKPGDGAQWDSTRQSQFAPYGIGLHPISRSLGYRRIGQSTLEGPHETAGLLVFRLALAGVTCSDARLRFYTRADFAGSFGLSSAPFRIYGIAADHFCSRFISNMYATTYTGLFHQHTFGTNQRRMRADSMQGDRDHTAEVAWNAPAGAGWVTSANIAAIVNEILGRAGWKSGNRLALVLAPNMPIADEPFAPDWGTYPGGGALMSTGCDGWDGISTDTTKIPQLDLTY